MFLTKFTRQPRLFALDVICLGGAQALKSRQSRGAESIGVCYVALERARSFFDCDRLSPSICLHSYSFRIAVFEIARVLVRLDHIARCIENAKR